jgi:hypothetical protein
MVPMRRNNRLTTQTQEEEKNGFAQIHREK